MTTHAPSLHVGAAGEVAAVAAGSYAWFVYRAEAPVAFLSTSLAALGEGEALETCVTVAGGASTTVTTQGPTTLLRTRSAVSQQWRFRLGRGAHVTFLPWVTIPFPGSRSELRVDVSLDAGASFVAWDTLAVGRVAAGEQFLFDELRSSWRIQGATGLVLDDRLAVRGSDREDAAILLDGRTHVGSLYAAGLDERSLPVSTVRSALDGLGATGASRPEPDLLVARALCDAGERLERAFWPSVLHARRALALPELTPADVARRWFPAL